VRAAAAFFAVAPVLAYHKDTIFVLILPPDRECHASSKSIGRTGKKHRRRSTNCTRKMDAIQIDIKKVVANKNEKLARKLPSFVYSIIAKIVHLKEINEILKECNGLSGADFAGGALKYLNVKGIIRYADRAEETFNCREKEKENKNFKYVFVSNHPLGGLDGLILISELTKRFGPAKFIVNDFLYNIQPLKDIFIPVNKMGKTSRANLENIKKAYADNYNLCNFPAGLCSRLINGDIKDTEWHKNFVGEAVESGRDIVPVFFSGRNSKAFYRLAKIRKFLGIKFNVEMMFLPHELFRQKGAEFSMVIGNPISPQEIKESGMNAQQWCNIIRGKVYEYGSSYSASR
jgi:hypothetical protein